MNRHIRDGIYCLINKNLEEMRVKFNSALSEAAVSKLEEKRLEVADSIIKK